MLRALSGLQQQANFVQAVMAGTPCAFRVYKPVARRTDLMTWLHQHQQLLLKLIAGEQLQL